MSPNEGNSKTPNEQAAAKAAFAVADGDAAALTLDAATPAENGRVAAAVPSDANAAAENVEAAVPGYARGSHRAPAPDPTVAAPRRGGAGYRAAKRAFDVAFSLCVTAAGLVPGALLCAAIALDSPGAPLFSQERVGMGGRPIRILKFRTMVADAHIAPERYMSPAQLEEWRREQKLDDDPRVTRVGRLLRRYSIDEFPQFLNVLAGDLSVIGPRPVTEGETLELGDARDEFLSVRPGITGWWQVTARNGATWESGERQALELFYVRHASLALDFRIFARTFKAMLGGTGK